MPTILVASDLSDRSRLAVRRGVELAAELHADLTVVHVVDAAMPTELAEQIKSNAEVMLLSEVVSDMAGRRVTHRVDVRVGDPVEEIRIAASEHEATLLVLGAHRRRVFMDNIKETTMERVVRASDVPVLLVARAFERSYQKVLAATALSPICAAALHKVQRIAPEAALHLFHAHEVSFAKEARRDFDTWRVSLDVPSGLAEPIYFEGKATDAVEELMEEGGYDLLVVAAHTRTARHRYLLGSFSAKMIRNPTCDVLIAK